MPNGGGFFVSLVIYNVPGGIGLVEQNVGASWVKLDNLEALGQQVVLKEPEDYRTYASSRAFDIRISSVSGTSYGEYKVEWPCGDMACSGYTDATMTSI
jgi:hypothetical protein